MSAAVVISSSPPRFFARDPTPVSPPGSQTISQNSPKRFKTSTTIRDSFSGGFSSARALLQRAGAENLPLHSTPPKERFKTRVQSPVRRSPPFITSRSASDLQSTKVARGQSPPALITVQPEESSGTLNEVANQCTPRATQKALPRRTDWTPVTDDFQAQGTPQSDSPTRVDAPRAAFMDSFGFKSTKSGQSVVGLSVDDQATVKRMKLDVIEVAGPIVQKAEKRKGRSAAPKKPKAPAKAKKAKTITDLVTAHQRGKKASDSPMADYLAASQVHILDGAGSHALLEVATTSKRPKTATLRKSKLLSPKSAMKAVVEQQPMFGSLSQLAREEPFLEADLSSDPVSPMRTQAISIEFTTPNAQRGTSRYARTSRLWGAGERDGNNALVFPDAVGLFNSPATSAPPAIDYTGMRSGLIGAAANARSGIAAASSSKIHVDSPTRAFHTSLVLDINEISSPASADMTVAHSHDQATEDGGSMIPQQKKRLRDLGVDKPGDQGKGALDGQETGNTDAPSMLPRPRYAGMHTDDLKKAIQGYGFKAIRSRQKMIEKLDECWDQKEARRLAKDAQPLATQTMPMKQSDFITNVHGLSARPAPKTKKLKTTKKNAKSPKEPKKRKRAITDSGEGTDSALVPPKEPKRRKSTASKPVEPSDVVAPSPETKSRKKATTQEAETGALEKPKKPRAKKAKALAVPKASIVDVDDIDDDFTTLDTLREEKEQQRVRLQAIEAEMPPTPPATLHITNTNGDAVSQGGVVKSAMITPSESAIGDRIYAAILHESQEASQADRHHVRNPTWHEKILMYDPIVLEDLAWWLNAEGLRQIEEDREVTALDVRSWCESNGICCLWKGGWRGQSSKKSSD